MNSFENKQKNAYEEYLEKASEVTQFERKQTLEACINGLIHSKNPQDQEKGYPFLGSILQCMTIRYNESVPTAGVCYNNKSKQFEMFINPYFFCRSLSYKERLAVLLHEMYHVTFKHVFWETTETTNKMQLNYAMDLVINQFINHLPAFALTIDKFRVKSTGQPFPPNKTTDFYYDLLNDAETKNPSYDPNAPKQEGKGEEKEDGSGNGMFDPSKEWIDVQEMMKQKEAQAFDQHDWDGEGDTKEKLEAVNDLIKRTMVKSSYDYNRLPKHMQDVLKELEVAIAKLNYKAILLSTLRKSLPGKDIQKTWKRPSRRYGDIAPGNKIGLMPKIEVFVDTSGSISHEEVNEFLKVANNFLTVGVDKCNISFFHTALYGTQRVKKNFQIDPNVLQSGGTDLQQVFERIEKVKPDLSIIITDGYYGSLDFDPKKMPQMVFIISKGGTTEHPLSKFGPSVKYGE